MTRRTDTPAAAQNRAQRPQNDADVAPRTFTFTAPLPPAECHQNARLHHYARNTATQEYRLEVGVCAFCAATHEAFHVPVGLSYTAGLKLRAYEAKLLRFDRARLSLEFIVPDRRRRDILNYAAGWKAGVDALVDVGLIPDDDAKHLSIGSLSMRVAAKGEATGVVVTLEEEA